MAAQTLSDLDSTVTFLENTVNATPQLLDSAVTFSDPNGSLNGGALTVFGALAEDRISIRDQGAGAGLIQFDSSTGAVSYGGVQIGTATGGSGTTFKVTFNASATATAAEALVENLTYANTSDTPTASHTLSVQVVSQLTGTSNPFNSASLGGTYPGIALGDIDHDGDIDLIAALSNGTLRTLTNTGTASAPSFGTSTQIGTIDVGSFASATLGDLDGDGDLDIVVGDLAGVLYTVTNTGTATAPSFATAVSLGISGLGGYAKPVLGDLDGDGDLDLVVTNKTGQLFAVMNVGSATAASFGTAVQIGTPNIGLFLSTALGDLDGDGDLDIVASSQAGQIFAIMNEGSATAASFGAPVQIGSFDVGSFGTLALGDLDGDGDLDIVVANQSGQLSTFLRSSAEIVVNVTAENDTPTGAPTATLAAGTEDTPYVIHASDLLAGFSDADGDTLSVSGLSTSSGTLVDNGDGTWTLTPAANFNGAVTLTYAVTDGHGGTLSGQTRGITLAAVNDAPTGTPTATLAAGSAGSAYVIHASDLLVGFSDTEGDTLSVSGLSTSAGTLVDNGDGTWTLTPAAGFSGAVTLTYAVTDGHGGSLSGQTQSLTFAAVNHAPAGTPTATLAAGTEDTPYVIHASDLLAGFSDADSDTLSVSGLSASAGTLVDNGDGTWTLTPAANFNGAVTLTYAVTDGHGGTLSGQTRGITLAAVNDAPTGAPTATLAAGAEDTPYIIHASDLLVGFSDADSDTLSVSGLSASAGTLVDNGDGTWTLTPAANFNGAVTLTYAVTDGHGGTLSGQTRGITLAAVNDAPAGTPTATLAAGTEDTPYVIHASDLLAGFSDADSDTLSVSGLSASAGTLVDNGDGTWTLTPAANFTGAVTLTYAVTDGHGGTLSGQTRGIALAAVNDAPTGTPTATLAAGSAGSAYVIHASDLLVGFSDAEGDTLSVSGLSASAGTLVDNGDGTWTLTPAAGFSGAVTLTYAVTDGHGGTLAGQTRGVTFASTVIPPTGVSDTFTLLQNASGVALDVLANDEGGDPTTRRITQVNDTALAVGQMMAVAGGTVLLSVAGQLVFTPGTDFHGSTAFTYGFTDSTGATGTGTVTGAVVRADELPLATADHFTLGSSGSSVAIDVVANDSHPGGAALTITQVNGHDIAAGRSVDVRGGQVLLNEHNTLVFTADPAFSGSVSFSYTAVDTSGFGAEATVTSSAALATLAPQIDAALDAHGLPRVADLGDLLAIASVVAPGAFGTAETTQGYHAGPGYALDLDTANANPDLLMQALLAIVGAQTSGTGHEVLTADASGSWTSSIDQSLVFQAALADSSDLELDLGADGTSALSLQPTMSAWSRAFAQQMLSADVSADFVTQSDGHAQAYSYQSTVAAGSQLSVDINGQTAGTPQAALSNLYGFVDFVSADGQSSVEVARTVMVAQTAGGADDQHATVTMRQNGVLHVQVEFYRVDDYSGTIDGLHPGDAGYDVASQTRAYQTTAGGTWISGAGYGELSTAELIGINSGDLVVMRLETPDHDFYAFAEANEVSNGTHVNHIWNYGLNTWGWEDLYGGGDQDFNDLVVRLDFNQQNALSGELV